MDVLVKLLGFLALLTAVFCQPSPIPPTAPPKSGIQPLFTFRTPPGMFIWSNVVGHHFNPYDMLTTEHLSEYLIGDTQIHSKTEIFLLMYDPMTLAEPDDPKATPDFLEKQNLAKEYYWQFYNQSGVMPSLTWFNTSFQSSNTFGSVEGDFVSYRLMVNPSDFYTTSLTVPPLDLQIELPANSGTWISRKTFLELPSWGFTRWRFSDAPLANWTRISAQDSFGRNSAGKLKPAPEFFRRLHCPCVLDFFVFYILTSDPQTGFDQLYLNIPLIKEDRWINATSSFCNREVNRNGTTPECRFERKTPILLTNDHLLVLTSKGLFVSDQLSASDARLSDPYLQKPLLDFRLMNPCAGGEGAELLDAVVCFGEPSQVTATGMEMFYNPVCHLYQHPNFRDTVILVVQHSRVGVYTNSSKAGDNLGPAVAFTILYADAPYNTWHILLKSISEFRDGVVTSIPAIFYNHQLNQFDLVVVVRAHGGSATRAIRHILHRPPVAAFYYSSLEDSPQKGFQGYDFGYDFKLTGVQLMPGSTDVFFYGNQLFIAEAAGFLVYQALGELYGSSVIDSCSFGHPDRFYVCVNKGNSVLLVGRVGSFYAPAEVYPHEVGVIKALLLRRGVMVPINSTWPEPQKVATMALNNARAIEFFRNAHFTVSYGGFLILWFMKSLEVTSTSSNFTLRHFEASSAPDPAALAAALQTFNQQPQAAASADTITRVEMSLEKEQFNAEARDGPLVPFPLDPVSCALYEAAVPETPVTRPTYLGRTHVGLDIICMEKNAQGLHTANRDCEVFIRHIKDLRGFLPGFESSVFTYVVDPIPMTPFHCSVNIKFIKENKVRLTFGGGAGAGVQSTPTTSTSTSTGPCWQDEYIGWTLFIPGHFSVLLEGETIPLTPSNSSSSTTPSSSGGSGPVEVEGLAIRQSMRLESIDVGPYESVLMDMSTPLYKRAQHWLRGLAPTPGATIGDRDRAWDVELDECNFVLSLVPNSILKGSGGHVFLDLQDFFTYKVRVVAIGGAKSRVMLQRSLLGLTNSNPLILNVDRDFNSKPGTGNQELTIVVRPSGVGTGIASVTVRTVACSPRCTSPCSFTIVFQLMRRQGARLRLDYPTQVPAKVILEAAKGSGLVLDKRGNALYRRLLVNYRPPSRRGNSVPTSRLIYNSDPAQPRHAHYRYQISRQTGEYGRCLGADSAATCRCSSSASDRLNDHPHYTDCRQMVYVLRRGVEASFRASYPPLMAEKDQNAVFFLNKSHLSVIVEEVNGRREYAIGSSSDSYLADINSDKELNLGHRYYDAASIRITCYATGLFHFKASLGEFDSFDQVDGYFMFFCEDSALNSISYGYVLLLTLAVAFLLLFFAFLHLRRRLLKHVPVQGETDKIKME